jgi:uncharacterized protein YaeQ
VALTSTVFTVAVDLSHVDRGMYESFEMKVAQHPSESDEYLLTRILAYCLEYTEGIAFSAGGVSSPDEPPLSVRDLTGRITAWIDIGLPDAERLHRAAKLTDRVVVYTHRGARLLLGQLEGKKIHNREAIVVHAFDRAFIVAASPLIERRTEVTLSVTEGHLYAAINGHSLETELESVTL